MTETASTAQALRELAAALEAVSDEAPLDIWAAARVIGVPVSTLRYWRQTGTGPDAYKVGRRLMYRRGALRAWNAQQETAARAGETVTGP